MSDQSSLRSLFCPSSIAVVGASATPQKIGAVPVSLLRKFGYAGDIYPVNPNAPEVQGLKCYPSLQSIGKPVDMVVLAVPASLAQAALEDAAAAGAKSAVMFTSGYAETGPDGVLQQQRLAALATQNGIRLLGPNCLGFMNVRQSIYATFSPAPNAGLVRAGPVGMVSQSGAFGAYAYSMARERGLGLSYWITTGNEADLDVADCIMWLVADEDTRVIMVYLEGCRDGDKLKHALSAARAAGKPVVVTKVGRTGSGAEAAASHTAALAGNDAVYDALFQQYGALRALTIDSFFNIGYALCIWAKPPKNRNLGIITVSGGVGALMADDAEEAGLQLPALGLEAQQEILKRVPFAGPRNPVDVTGQATSDPQLLEQAATLMLKDGAYGSLLVFLAAAGTSDALWPHFKAFAQKLRAGFPDTPLALCSLFSPERRAELEGLGCLVFADPSAAVRAIAAISPRPAVSEAVSEADASAPADARTPLPHGPLNEASALVVLQEAGIPTMQFQIVRGAEAAAAAAESLGYPVVLKIVSPDITHKSDVGGVRLALADAAAVRDAFDAIMQSVRDNAPGATLDGMLVAPMIRDGVECILGVQRDPVFGPIVMFGLGGIFVETMKDVSFRLAPFGREEALRMIDEVQARSLLQGARGRPVADVGALADALARLSRFAVAMQDEIDSIDINPFTVLPNGRGALALDAVIIRRHDQLATGPGLT
ncbi:MAG: 6-carboxyhexanoate-CoA ligase [Herminiimonas sp.]|nr:6-carboxyhexanoate-CoA ligase [Herminiimonas sp.]